VLACAVIWWSACTLITPWAAFRPLPVLIAARIGLGLGEAAVLPATTELFSRWVGGTRAVAGDDPLPQRHSGRSDCGLRGDGLAHESLWLPTSFYLSARSTRLGDDVVTRLRQ